MNINGNNYNYGGPQQSIPNPFGFYGSIGIKTFFNPDFWIDGMYRYNKMQGFYFMPEIVGGYFKYYDYSYSNGWGYPTTLLKYGVAPYAVILNFGKQWVFSNLVVLNIYGGVGYGGYALYGGQPQTYEPSLANMYDFLLAGPVTFSGGIDIGILLK